MSKRNDFLLLDAILLSLLSIAEYTNGMSYDDFLNSRITIDAVIRNFEICGEASNYISEEFKLLHPQIEWRKLVDFRKSSYSSLLWYKSRYCLGCYYY